MDETAIPANLSSVLRLVYGAGATKKVARRHGVSLATARSWLAAGATPLRIDQVAARLEADMARHRAELARAEMWIDQILRRGAGEWRGCASLRPGRSNGPAGVRSGSEP